MLEIDPPINEKKPNIAAAEPAICGGKMFIAPALAVGLIKPMPQETNIMLIISVAIVK